MAATGTPTPNIGLRIPQGTDPASVADINYNSTVIDQKVGPVGNTSLQEQVNSAEEAMAYVINGNDAPSGGIPSSKYVYVKNNTNGIATGMYITTAAISSGATVQASSLSACAEGAANALNSKITDIRETSVLTNIILRRVGNVVSMFISDGMYNTNSSANIIDGSSNEAKVPSGYKPIWTTTFLEAYDAKRLTVQTNGTIQINGQASQTGVILRASATWITSDAMPS